MSSEAGTASWTTASGQRAGHVGHILAAGVGEQVAPSEPRLGSRCLAWEVVRAVHSAHGRPRTRVGRPPVAADRVPVITSSPPRPTPAPGTRGSCTAPTGSRPVGVGVTTDLQADLGSNHPKASRARHRASLCHPIATANVLDRMSVARGDARGATSPASYRTRRTDARSWLVGSLACGLLDARWRRLVASPPVNRGVPDRRVWRQDRIRLKVPGRPVRRGFPRGRCPAPSASTCRCCEAGRLTACGGRSRRVSAIQDDHDSPDRPGVQRMKAPSGRQRLDDAGRPQVPDRHLDALHRAAARAPTTSRQPRR
jgi:hypothetical protein